MPKAPPREESGQVSYCLRLYYARHPPMSIAWNAFTPASALIGGAIIGAAAALFAVLHGRVAGGSGILRGLPRPPAGGNSWRVALLPRTLAAPLALKPLLA